MSVIEEILKIKNKLSKMSNDNTMGSETCRDQALDLLRTLQKMPMTVELLLKTRIGLSVNTFRKSNVDSEVLCLAKEILRDWKKLIPVDITKNRFSSDITDTKKIENSADNIKKNPSSVMTSDNHVDSARLKCRDLLENTLILYASILKDCTCPKKLAAELENIIYQHHKNSMNSCEKCLQRKERKERSKQMEADLREQEKHLSSAVNLERSQISENQHTQLQQQDSKVFNLLQSLKELRASSVNKQNNIAQDIEFIP